MPQGQQQVPFQNIPRFDSFIRWTCKEPEQGKNIKKFEGNGMKSLSEAVRNKDAGCHYGLASGYTTV